MSRLDIALFTREDEHIGHGEISARRQLGARIVAFIDLLQFSAVQLMCPLYHPDTRYLHNDLDVTKPPVARCVLRRSPKFTTSPYPRRPRQTYSDNLLRVSKCLESWGAATEESFSDIESR